MKVLQDITSVPLERIDHPVPARHGVSLSLLRLDLAGGITGGNKWFKLKYNISEMRRQNQNTLLTFGGAWSNHIAATAAAGKESGFSTIGIIRGEEHAEENNVTLRKAAEDGMKLLFVTRAEYKRRKEKEFIDSLRSRFGDFYLVPEGGSNPLGVKGCREIVPLIKEDFDFLCCPVGTGSTLAGLIPGLKQKQYALGFTVLAEAGFLEEDVKRMLQEQECLAMNWELVHGYDFGRYGSVTKELYRFVKEFRASLGIQLDFMYTGKMMFGILDQISKGRFVPGEKIVALHTGGIQGNAGIDHRKFSP